MPVFRIYVEKKPEFAVEASGILADLKSALRQKGLIGLRVANRYDVEGIGQDVFEAAKNTVFSEPQADLCAPSLEALNPGSRVFGFEYLPGQFDQRADSCAQCIQLMTQGERPAVRTARIVMLEGELSDEDFSRIKAYMINPVESREASLELPETLAVNFETPQKVKILKNFISLNRDQLAEFGRQFGLAMDTDDIAFCQQYFKNVEKRDPYVTEIRVIDTYWSDHCRHTTFLTEIDNVEIVPDYIERTYKKYCKARAEIYGNKERPITLMDLAVIGMKKLKKDGLLGDLDQSDEINACSVKIKADIDGKDEDWLLMFKNETHNHPTEIEPFGGAATCLGGAIRDPLSGRSYVYQAMRVTGSADPRLPIEKTLKGKLPQRKITLGAAQGYSSYGNQIGLSTGHVSEIYHPGYAAKRLEIGAVVGAAPEKNVIRKKPEPGDIVILLGGRTGRDGCGGATGSSKSHTLESLSSCGAEVQKGNPPEERKLQRLFRNPKVTALIKRCNDFGAGGVAVAVGELADGLEISLNAVPKKYEGLDGTELAISESQERMAVVVSQKDTDQFILEASKENLEATIIAVITAEPRLKMFWNKAEIVNITREFLDSNGAKKHAKAAIPAPDTQKLYPAIEAPNLSDRWKAMLSDLNVCSKKGLVERFDSSIGAGTVLMPYGGVRQMTPSQAMAAKLPVLDGNTTTCSLMGWGFDPSLSEKSPYHGAAMAVVESVAQIIAAGGSHKKAWLSFQEYFGRTTEDPERWGKPFAALLGALEAQLSLGIAAIGGKDSMSGTFENLDVPPTLVSFACGVANAQRVVSTEFKAPGDKVYLIRPKTDKNGMPDFKSVLHVFDKVERLIASRRVKAAWAVSKGGAAEALTKMAFGNAIGFEAKKNLDTKMLFEPCYGGFVLETGSNAILHARLLGTTSSSPSINIDGLSMPLSELEKAWTKPLEEIFPTCVKPQSSTASVYRCPTRSKARPKIHVTSPNVLIPVFPGTNCEYDTARSFEAAGAMCETFVVRNLSARDIEESVLKFESLIRKSQIIMIPGGFSGGDEPDGSGKFIKAFFRNPRIKDAVTDLLQNRDGLILGICNGFQALVKLGLVPFGEIRDLDENCPTLTFNSIGRHQSKMVRTRISSVKSPWLSYVNEGDIFTLPVSHGEGRFFAPADVIAKLAENGQIATQYVDLNGRPSMDSAFNPNASIDAVEGILSPDGRVFGKMAHSERIGKYVAKNIPGEKDQRIFAAGVDYFSI